MHVPLVLASASPARLATLRSAGIDPTVIVSDVDEDAVLARARATDPLLAPAEAVQLLARAKAEGVADEVSRRLVGPRAPGVAGAAARGGSAAGAGGALVLGCDSMLELEDEVMGKPGSAEVATERWRRMRGASGTLHTGHWLIDLRTAGEQPGGARTADGPGGGTGVGATSSTVVRFADLSDAEIDAYVATGEPLHVAGAFTIDGLGGPFVTGVEGDHHGVVGLSLPLLRALLGRLGVSVTDLWNHA